MDDLEDKTCMYRFFGDCPDCTRDYTSELNNTHCPKYCEIHVGYFEVKDDKKDNV